MRLLLMVLTTCATLTVAQDTRFQFEPGGAENLKLREASTLTINYTSTLNITLVIQPRDDRIVQLEQSLFLLGPCNRSVSAECRVDVVMVARRVGRTLLMIRSYKSDLPDTDDERSQYNLTVSVVAKETPLKVAMGYMTSAFLVIINFVMGCKIQWQKVKQVFRHPAGLLLGLTGQILFMPLLAFALANAFFLDNGLSLGLLIVGTSPGGGISNMVAVVTDGDLDLSASMTISSTLLSFGVMPLWLFTYGQFFRGKLLIPYINILINLCLCSVPLMFGVLLKHKRPRWAEKLLRFVRPFSIIVLMVMIGAGIYANLDVFALLSWRSTIPCLILPITGLTAGALIAVIFRQNIARVKTISLEVGIQNTILAISVVQLSWQSPERDLIFVMPASVLILTLLIVLLICLLHIILGRYSRAYRKFNLVERPPEKEEVTEKNDKTVEKMIDSGDIILKENTIQMDEIELTTRNEPDRECVILHREDSNINCDSDEQKLSDKVVNVDITPRHKNGHVKPSRHNDLENGKRISTPENRIRFNACQFDNAIPANYENYETQSNTIEFESENDEEPQTETQNIELDKVHDDVNSKKNVRYVQVPSHTNLCRSDSETSSVYQTAL